MNDAATQTVDAADELSALLADAAGDDLVPEAEVFHICDAKTANWVVRKIVDAREYGRRVKIWAAQELHRAEREEERLLYLFGGQLDTWAKCELQKLKGRKKSVALPAATLGYRHEPDRLIVSDEQALLVWAKEHCPAAVEVVEKLLKTPINELFVATGELPPGTELQTARDKFYIR